LIFPNPELPIPIPIQHRLFMRVFLFLLVVFSAACSPSRQISKIAEKNVLNDPSLQAAHVGICIFDPSSKKYLYNFQGDKYFVPASNTKLPTCYAAMKYLGDSLPGLRYLVFNGDLYAQGTGDPTFLQPEFSRQPVIDFLKKFPNKIFFNVGPWHDNRWGSGWSWNDYSENYMAERSPFPIYGNVVRTSGQVKSLQVQPHFFSAYFAKDSSLEQDFFPSSIQREMNSNHFVIERRTRNVSSVETPFYTEDLSIIIKLLSDTLHREISGNAYPAVQKESVADVLRSQPTDSLLTPMMHRSDNFYAEQALLMVSNEKIGVMNDARIIDTLLKSDLKDLPQRPRWVDGSGLSRYNLFTPQDLVAILDKMQTEFGMQRIKNILPTGNTGTLTGYYKSDSGFIYAKTGTLSGVVAFSGIMYTAKNRMLIFSVLVNNHQASAPAIRRAVEKFIEEVRKRN
jgi:D-alanyl-D-alanine carboxypeptidase/D-alanyl-D-alanine-endopeptidase (penicillin-binding protein 4)